MNSLEDIVQRFNTFIEDLFLVNRTKKPVPWSNLLTFEQNLKNRNSTLLELLSQAEKELPVKPKVGFNPLPTFPLASLADQLSFILSPHLFKVIRMCFSSIFSQNLTNACTSKNHFEQTGIFRIYSMFTLRHPHQILLVNQQARIRHAMDK